ncbi:MAG: transglutaminase domain-containing protein [Cellulosilyticaceae bacterium]
MKRRSLHVLVFCLWCIQCTLLFAVNKPIITPLGNVNQMKVQLQLGEKGMLSRDGSLATVVESGAVITKPGRYYLTKTSEKNNISITQFTIPYQRVVTQYKLTTLDELEEVIKQLFEQQVSEVTLRFPTGNYTSEQVFKLIETTAERVSMKYPALTYEEYGMTYAGGARPILTMKITYPIEDAALAKQYTQKMYTLIPQIINGQVTENMMDYEREWELVDYVVNQVTYLDNGSNQIHTMEGAVIDRVAVCDGYSRLIMYLLNSVGVPTQMVIGKTGDIGHSWNMVKIQNKMYHLDVTWADQDKNQIGNFYDYVNENDDYMALTHTWDRKTTPRAVDRMYSSVYMPMEVPSVYRVDDATEWQQVRKQLGKDGYKEATLMFYNNSAKKWNKDKLLNQIMEAENAGIQYFDFEKYNTWIVQYRTTY